jgi:integrase
MLKTSFRFNHRSLEKLPPHTGIGGASEAEYTDDETPGLKVAVGRGGRKFFRFRYTYNGAKGVIKLGEFPAISVDEARKLALMARAKVDAGIDPKFAPVIKMAPTFREFVEKTYIPATAKTKRSHVNDLSKLETRIFSAFGNLRMTDIKTSDIRNYLGGLKGQLADSTSNRHRALLSSIFKLAMDDDIVENNPCAKVKQLKENNIKERYLSFPEIKRFMEAAGLEPNQVAADYLKLLLFTGTRRMEALSAKWQDVHLEARAWTLPTTKSGKARVVQLNDLAVELLTRMQECSKSPYLFPGQTNDVHLVNPQKAFMRILGMAGIGNFRIHDFRHTFASLAVAGGATLYQVQQLLGHASSQTTQRYAHLSNMAMQGATGVVSNAVLEAMK